LKNGEAVQFLLKDEQNNALGTQNITITFVENGVNQTYSVITDNEGKASLVLNNENPGSYDVIVSYNGTASYNGCSAKQTITIEEGTAETTESSDSSSSPVQSNSSAGTAMYNGNSSSSSAELYYDSQYNFYYDQNGIIRGGQNDGYSADYIRNIYESGNMVDEEGNLQ
ncbi:MAG: Ig-like domain repeat protein, partial [Clostridia bacterium]|nr:Ig-like domain repeat protein [Clostridia bacterium]